MLLLHRRNPESISKNITWGIEKAFQEGKVRYRLDQTLGYRMGANGKPEIVESEAEHVRWIFRMFAAGHSMGEIATMLTEKKIMRRNGETAWTRANVQRILTNEKYVGDAILQKSYTVDCLTHERKKTAVKEQNIICVTAMMRLSTGTHGTGYIWNLQEEVLK